MPSVAATPRFIAWELTRSITVIPKERMESVWENSESNRELQEFHLQHRIEETVECITFAQILNKYKLASFDLLQINTKGYELEILSTIDFAQTPIRFINYESMSLHEKKPNAEQLMRDGGY